MNAHNPVQDKRARVAVSAPKPIVTLSGSEDERRSDAFLAGLLKSKENRMNRAVLMFEI